MKNLTDIFMAAGSLFFDCARSSVQEYAARAAQRSKKTVTGIAILAVSSGIFFLSAIFLFAALFFALADLDRYVSPALVCALTALVSGIIVAVFGLSVMKKRPAGDRSESRIPPGSVSAGRTCSRLGRVMPR